MKTSLSILIRSTFAAALLVLCLPTSPASAAFVPLPIGELSCEQTAAALFTADADQGYGAEATDRYSAEMTFGYDRTAENTPTTARMRCIAGGFTSDGALSSISGYFEYEYISPDREQGFLTELNDRTMTSFDTAAGPVLLVMAQSFDGPPNFEYVQYSEGYLYTVGRYPHFNDYQSLYDYENPAANAPVPADVDVAQLAYMRDQVVASELLLQPEPEPEPTPAPVAKPVKPSLDTPSTFSGLTRFGDVNVTPAAAVAVGASSLVFVALLAFPTRLLQISVAESYARGLARFRASTANKFKGMRRFTDWLAALPRAVKIVAGLAVASLITGFLSPNFGFNGESLRVFGSILLGNVIEAAVVFGILLALLKRSGAKASLSLKLGSLLIVIGSVLLSRLTGFEPGVVFGLVLTLVIASHGSLHSSRVALIEWFVLIVLGLGSWMLYSAIPAPEASGNNPWSLLGIELLSSLTIGALAALPIAYLPFNGLPGKRIVEGRGGWWLWGAAYAVGLVVFFTVIMPFPGSFAEISTPFATWLALFVGYAVVAVIAFLVSLGTRRGTS